MTLKIAAAHPPGWCHSRYLTVLPQRYNDNLSSDNRVGGDWCGKARHRSNEGDYVLPILWQKNCQSCCSVHRLWQSNTTL